MDDDDEEQEPALESAGMMRWLLTYADVITLLLVFFIVLYSLSVIQKQRYQALVQALRVVFQGKRVMVNKIHKNQTAPYPIHHPGSTIARVRLRVSAQETSLYKKLEHVVGADHLRHAVLVELVPYGIQVVFLHGILFASGSSALMSTAYRALNAIGGVVAPVPNGLVVQGYANNLPIHTVLYQSNWDLSVDRAAHVIDYWRKQYNMVPTRFMAEGFGSWAPLAPNTTVQGRTQNRAATVLVLNRPVNLRQVAFGPGSELP